MTTSNATFREYRAAHPDSVPIFQAELGVLAGAERSLLALATWLHGRGRAVHMVTYADSCDFAQFASFSLPIHAIAPGAGFRGRLGALRAYWRECATVPPLISGYQSALHGTLAGVGKFHCLMHDTPVLFEADMEHRSWKQRMRFAVSNRIIGYGMQSGGGRMIVTSEFLQRDCRVLFDVEADIARMGGMGDAGGFHPRPVERRLNMLSVCRIEGNKRVDWMLDALAAMEGGPQPLSSRVDWRLDLAGKGALLEAMRARAGELGLSSRVQFHGFVSDEELAGLYDRAHLFLMPAVQGYGIPAIEALGRGIPVLLHRESGVSDVLLDTPWAAVMTGGKEELEPTLAALVARLLRGEHLSAAPPELPSESAWAERVARLCGYV